MSIEKDIVEWANGRAPWQRVLIHKIVKGEAIDDAFIASFASQIVAGTVVAPPTKLTATDLPTGSSGGPSVCLTGVCDVKNVNGLVDGQSLTFGDVGLTIAYGDNGSGKSGYARVVKELTDARHKEPVLPDAFNPNAGKLQSAEVKFSVDGTACSDTWPDVADPNLRRIHFYDEACGDDYLMNETELTYRPSVLAVFDALIKATDRLRGELDALIQKNEATCAALPELTDGTSSRTFLDSLSAKTSVADVDAALQLPAKADEQLAKLMQEEVRLKATDPAREQARLKTGATQVAALAVHFEKLSETLSPEAVSAAEGLAAEAVKVRKAADAASSADFEGEPLKGVGSETWRLLWQAAEAYSVSEAYPDREFPCIDEGDSCPFCQQPIEASARARLERFHKFVNDETARNAEAAEAKAGAAKATIKDIAISSPQTTAAITFLTVEDAKHGEALELALSTAQLAKERASKRLAGDTSDKALELHAVDTERLKNLAADLKTRADAIDDAEFKGKLAGVTSDKGELADKIELGKHRKAIIAEIDRMKDLRTLVGVRAILTTGPMTTKSNDLARKYVTDSVKKRFVAECSNLGLTRVALADKGGDKGKLRHKPTLSGASAGRTPVEVLSEGEQTALGLSGLFTEINFDGTKSAVIFDDPITSLDHGRREKVARRIVEIAADRQVIVFTHDLTFLGDLVRAADEASVTLTERSIERNGLSEPGLVLDAYPWKAKDVKSRLNGLGTSLASIKKHQVSMTAEEYEKATSDWGGQLSETWERMVRNDVVYKVVDRGSSEVRPKMVRLLARLTEEDNKDFQAGYSACSKWARRHDKSEEVNFTPPSIAEMQAELDRAVAWQKRIAGYAN